jgi:hypothetical protein
MSILGALGGVQTDDLRGRSPIKARPRRVSMMQETDVGSALTHRRGGESGSALGILRLLIVLHIAAVAVTHAQH